MGEVELISSEGEIPGVLLYYKYAPIPDVNDLVRLYHSNCNSLGLRGRVRIAHDGVNVTIGGKMSSLENHIEFIKNNSLFDGTDFKLAKCDQPLDEKIATDCGFTSMSIRLVKELVTFKSHPLVKSPNISSAGKHLSATEFHSVLQNASNEFDVDGSQKHQKVILLDARNIYETRIGMFQTPDVDTMNPEIRQYSDLPAWIDTNSKCMQGKHVLMYCTGGIRCEMASSYIRSKGVGYENVYQLFGGIQRYLDQFPDGGFFKGRNFVFDHRISVGSRNTDVVGSCLLCGSSFDDYSPRCRCTFCRMLVLVCDSCQGDSCSAYVCELCQKLGKRNGISASLDGNLCFARASDLALDTELEVNIQSRNTIPLRELSLGDDGRPRKLKILCLHGFRQNASSFKGRTASLTKKLKHIAEFIFVDGLHELQLIYQESISSSYSSQHFRKKRFGWLVSSTLDSENVLAEWKIAGQAFDPNQYEKQCEGFEESYTYLKSILSSRGPFDGILGFSQGAAMAALVCEQQQRRAGISDFRFAILCSGFSLLPETTGLRCINLPSLHVFGSRKGKDKQIDCEASKKLSSLFDEGCSMTIEHDMGHIIPAKPPYINQFEEFLRRFV